MEDENSMTAPTEGTDVLMKGWGLREEVESALRDLALLG